MEKREEGLRIDHKLALLLSSFLPSLPQYMTLDQFKYVYFLGIGGIGMSALARWFQVNGYAVAGYDKTPTALTDALQAEGMVIHFTDDIDQIPADFRENPAQKRW